MSELAQGFLIGVVLAVAGGALMIYLHRVTTASPPPEDADERQTSPEERPR